MKKIKVESKYWKFEEKLKIKNWELDYDWGGGYSLDRGPIPPIFDNRESEKAIKEVGMSMGRNPPLPSV